MSVKTVKSVGPSSEYKFLNMLIEISLPLIGDRLVNKKVPSIN